jgi:hypothetical protein
VIVTRTPLLKHSDNFKVTPLIEANQMLKRSNSQGEIDFLGNACTNLLEDNNDQLFNGNGYLGGSFYPHGG